MKARAPNKDSTSSKVEDIVWETASMHVDDKLLDSFKVSCITIEL